MFFDQLMFSCANGIFRKPRPTVHPHQEAPYQSCLPEVPKSGAEDVVIVTNCAQEDVGTRPIRISISGGAPQKEPRGKHPGIPLLRRVPGLFWLRHYREMCP